MMMEKFKMMKERGMNFFWCNAFINLILVIIQAVLIFLNVNIYNQWRLAGFQA